MAIDSDKSLLWQTRIAQHAESGMSISAFCRVNKISEASFYYWRKSLRERACTAQESPQQSSEFMEVEFATSHGALSSLAWAEIILPSGLTIRILDGCSESMASSILRATSAVYASC